MLSRYDLSLLPLFLPLKTPTLPATYYKSTTIGQRTPPILPPN